MKKYKTRFFILLTVFLLLETAGCQKDSTLDHLSKILEVPVNNGNIVTYSNTHGGFLGDGETLVEIHFSDDSCLEEIKESTEWNPLPLTDNLTALIYGLNTKNGGFGPVLTEVQIPEVTKGYYCFIDRHSDSTDKKDDSAVLARMSYNFNIALYDTDTDTLYYIELDT